jgi:hypothetical protein
MEIRSELGQAAKIIVRVHVLIGETISVNTIRTV